MDTAKTIETVARRQGISSRQVRADMIVAIHRAFLAHEPAFTMLFGNREPSPEEFMRISANEISKIAQV